MILYVLLTGSTALAQLLVDHQAKAAVDGFVLTPSLSFSEIEYDIDNRGDTDVERSILGVALAFGLTNAVDMYAELGYIAEAELEGRSDDGDGFMFGAGVKAVIYREGNFSIHAIVGAHHLREDYGTNSDADLFELQALATARGQFTQQFGGYAGLEVVPISAGDIDRSGRGDVDFERDDRVGLRLGADYTFGNGVKINPEVALVSETLFALRVSIPLP